MKKRLLLFFLCLSCLISAITALAEENTAPESTADRVKNLIGGICASLTNEKELQDWISSSLSSAPAADWYAITLSQMGEYDLSSLYEFLLSAFQNASPRAAVTRQKYALALLAIDSDAACIRSEIDETIGSQGIMSWVYGLHLIHNGFPSELHTENAVCETLVSMQLADGGWALSGQYGNVDVTAMTMQALAPYAGENPAVKTALDLALPLLSSLQEEDATYKSYGVSNPESASQVIVALTAMGIDPFTDERFIKNGNTLLDALSLFVLPDGTFSHTLGGVSSPMATVQSLYALVSYERMLEGKTPFYTFDKTNAPSPAPSLRSASSVPLYKWIALGAGCTVSLVSALVLFLLKKRSFKNYLFILLLLAAFSLFIFLSDFESADSFYTDSPNQKDNAIGSVTIEIRCDTVSGADKRHIPSDGVILEKTEFALSEGDTVYDILLDACRQNKIHMEKSGAQGMIYIAGLNYIYEFDFGDLSGWQYYVNGVSPSVGCDQIKLRDQDEIKWLYSLELGNDISE